MSRITDFAKDALFPSYALSSRGRDEEKMHARGSAFKVQTQFAIGEALEFGDRELHGRADALASEVGKMLISMMSKLPASRKRATV